VGRRRRLDELEFETALVGALEDGYGLRVRAERDRLDRRRHGYASLSFDYTYDSSKSSCAVVTVRIEGVDVSQQFRVDLSDRETIEIAIAGAEPLALAIHTRLEHEKPDADAPGRRRFED
jgi:hypothetical protein